MKRGLFFGFFIVLVINVPLGCRKTKDFAELQYAERNELQWGQTPEIINDFAILNRVRDDSVTQFFWIQHNAADSTYKNCYRFDVYGFFGKYMSGYYYYLLDSGRFRNNKAIQEFIEDSLMTTANKRLKIESFMMRQNEEGAVFLKANGRTYRMYEFVPFGLDPYRSTRLFYWDWRLPEQLPVHTALSDVVDDHARVYEYYWMVYDSSYLISDKSRRVMFDVYNYSADLINVFEFTINATDTVNLADYAFYKTLFEWYPTIFQFGGKRYEILDRKVGERFKPVRED